MYETVVFRLYIAAGAPNSVLALANLRRLCERYLPGRHQIEVINVLETPRRALEAQVLVTPTLVKVSPAPGWQMAGNLTDTATILRSLGLDEEPDDG